MKMSVASNEAGGVKVERGNTEKVTLGGKEYIRGKVEFELNGKSYQYFYARKLDDELICTIMISGLAKDEPGDYEKLFE